MDSSSDRPFRVLFAGTPETAVPSLEALVDHGFDVVAVLTRPDAPVGRRRVLTPSPVARRAADLGIPVLKADRLTGPDAEPVLGQIRDLNLDVAAVVAYGALVPAAGLHLPRLGWVNLHFSLLPAHRGAAPVQHAVIQGDRLTGACVFQLETGLDTGPVFSRLERAVEPSETAGEVLADLSRSGAELLAHTLAELRSGTAHARPQTGEPTLAPKLTQKDGRIDPSASARSVAARINGVTPEPGAWAVTQGEPAQRIKLIGASPVDTATEQDWGGRAPGDLVATRREVLLVCADGAVRLDRVQPAGKKPMPAADWLRGQPSTPRFDTGAQR